jgi:hypothetical protein
MLELKLDDRQPSRDELRSNPKFEKPSLLTWRACQVEYVEIAASSSGKRG